MAAGTGTISPEALRELLDPELMARLDRLDVLSLKILQGKLQGERRSKRRGQSVEFADHKPYSVGDDLRFVDWNIYGRLEKLFLKLFLEEQDLSVQVLLDASGSGDYGQPNKAWAMRRLAAALTYVGLASNSRVTLSAFRERIVSQFANMRGRRYVYRIAELLVGLESTGPSDFDAACRQLVASRLGRGVVVVISDFLFKEGYESGLRRLLGRDYDVYAIQMLSPQELEPTLSGDLKLLDVEDADTAEVTVNASLLKYYRRTLNAYCNELRQFCVRRDATHALASTAEPTQRLLLTHLRRRGLLG